MAGVGKSFYGKKMAEKLGIRFVDLDDALFKRTGMDTTALLESVGDEKFIELENTALQNIMHLDEKIVLSPGGSICYCTAMNEAKEKYFIVYLEGDLETIIDRVEKEPRGIVYSRIYLIEEIFRGRDLLYRDWAHLVVDAKKPEDWEKNLELILRAIENRENKLPAN